IYKIDLEGAADVALMDANHAAANAVGKTLFLDVVKVLTDNGFDVTQIPAKLEGITFGPDVELDGVKTHTFWLANDNDFTLDFNDVARSNPNQFFVSAFTDADLANSKFVPQRVRDFFFPFF